MVTEKIWGNSIGAFVAYGKDGSTLVPLKLNADGELVVNLEAATVNIGDVDVASIASGTNLIGKVGIDQTTDGTTNAVHLTAGTNTIGATKDAGPSWTVTRTYTTSADMTTAAAISPAASASMKLVADDILVSAAVAMEFSIQQETEATVFASVFIPANGTVQITMRDGLKTATAVRKFFGKASVAGNVRITCCTHEEA